MLKIFHVLDITVFLLYYKNIPVELLKDLIKVGPVLVYLSIVNG